MIRLIKKIFYSPFREDWERLLENSKFRLDIAIKFNLPKEHVAECQEHHDKILKEYKFRYGEPQLPNKETDDKKRS